MQTNLKAFIKKDIFKAYDIRGIYPEEVNEKFAYFLGRVFVRVFRQKEIVVGRDMRLSSPSLSKALIRGLLDEGATLYDIGLISTPSFYFAVQYLKKPAGLQVSASHNPKEYNGFKIVLADKLGIIKVGLENGLDKIRDYFLKQKISLKKTPRKGAIHRIRGIVEKEVQYFLKEVPLPEDLSFKIVADPANAMGGQYLETFFERFKKINLIKMNFRFDGRFPAHEPNPLIYETLNSLRKRIIKEKADFGIAPDGDGDRIFFLDENGKIIPASLITALIAQELLRDFPGEKILYDVRYVFNPREAIKKAQGKPLVCRVGHALISQKLRKVNGLFAGESSGHFFFRFSGFAESSLLVLIYLLRCLAREKKPLSKVIRTCQVAFESGEMNFRLTSREKIKQIFQELEEKYQNLGKILKIDGLAIEFSDWRFSLRASNTEPLMRLNIEAFNRKKLLQKKRELLSFLRSKI